jgi:hypothetical protein
VEYKNGTPLSLLACARVSLVDQGCYEEGHGPISLFFTREEFNDAISRFRGQDIKSIEMDLELKETLFTWTAGHPGALGDILRSLASLVRIPISV